MRKALRIYCLLAMVLGPLTLLAQPKLAIDDPVPTVPTDTLYYNSGNGDSVITYNITVENVGNLKLDGPVKIYFRYNGDTTSYVMDQFTVTNFESGMTMSRTVKDTVRGTSGNRYKGGDNVLVIWPHSDNPMAAPPDTSGGEIYIDGLLSIDDPKEFLARIKAYPNPVRDQMTLQYMKDRHKVEYVRIINPVGQVLRVHTRATETLDFDGITDGIYFVEVRYRDGIKGTFRVQLLR